MKMYVFTQKAISEKQYSTQVVRDNPIGKSWLIEASPIFLLTLRRRSPSPSSKAAPNRNKCNKQSNKQRRMQQNSHSKKVQNATITIYMYEGNHIYGGFCFCWSYHFILSSPSTRCFSSKCIFLLLALFRGTLLGKQKLPSCYFHATRAGKWTKYICSVLYI